MAVKKVKSVVKHSTAPISRSLVPFLKHEKMPSANVIYMGSVIREIKEAVSAPSNFTNQMPDRVYL